jgi:hypothetical protein
MEFILPSEKTVSVSVNDSSPEKVNPIFLKVSDLEKEGYRLSDLCKFCNETINKLYTVSFNSKFKMGVNIIRVEYEQPLAISESSYGYFRTSKWINGFAYDLWPLREWKLDPKFEMNVKFTTEAGNAWNRFFSQKLVAECRGMDLRFITRPGTPFKKEIGANGSNEYYKYNQNLHPFYNLNDSSKTYYENDKLIYELNLKEKFPDRLNCYFGHDR